jgi:hypothetical protein
MIALLAGLAMANDCETIMELAASGADEAEVVRLAVSLGPDDVLAYCLEQNKAAPAVIEAARRGRHLAAPAAQPKAAPTVSPAVREEWRPSEPSLSPTGALGLSVAVGFGSGHFYARRSDLGLLFLLSQAAGVGLVYQGSTEVNLPMVQGGTALLVGSRLLEVATVGFVADHQAQAR